MADDPRDDTGRDLPRQAKLTLPAYYFYSTNEIPVRFFATADGAMDVERFDVETGGFVRALGFVPEILFNPSTSAHVERVSEAAFEQRVRQLREQSQSSKARKP